MTPSAVVKEWVRRFNAADVDGLAALHRKLDGQLEREAVGRRDRLHDHGRGVAAAQRAASDTRLLMHEGLRQKENGRTQGPADPVGPCRWTRVRGVMAREQRSGPDGHVGRCVRLSRRARTDLALISG